MTVPDQVIRYLTEGSLAGLWPKVRAKLERDGLEPGGSVAVTLDEHGAQQLEGLTGKPVKPGRVRVRLDVLDARLQVSAAQMGLLEMVEAITGQPLTDRRQLVSAEREASAALWVTIDNALRAAGFTTEQSAVFTEGVRRPGILTRAAHDLSLVAVKRFAAGLLKLAQYGPVEDQSDAAPKWGLGELASLCTGSSHGFDSDQLASKLMMRALAAARGEEVPISEGGRRRLWGMVGVVADDVSGTAMTYGFRPTEDDAWSQMMRARADLGVVTHLTVQELDVADGATLAAQGTVVFACENPQILAAAARDRVQHPVLCLNGAGSLAGWKVVRQLVTEGCIVRYHGDFDWDGVRIAARVFDAGGQLWRMDATDYESAVAAASESFLLDGKPATTVWDEELGEAMTRAGVGVHEESVVRLLLSDMTTQG